MHRLWFIVIAALLVTACGGGSSGSGGGGGDTSPPPAPTPMFEGMDVVNFPMAVTSPASADSPYANQLRDCVFSNTRSESCTLGTLPLLGMDTRNPTIDDVMDRVLVSHEWMGTRFRDLLEALPDDMLLLMRGVTAVVISSDVRPSFYWTRTGAIYLDPDYIWLTPEERADIPTRRTSAAISVATCNSRCRGAMSRTMRRRIPDLGSGTRCRAPSTT
jgi:hypothetical protein